MAIDGLGQSNVASAYKAPDVARTEIASPVKAAETSLQQDTVVISSEAKALLSNEATNPDVVQPMSAGGTTLPPWPPKK